MTRPGNYNHLPEPQAGDIADDDITALRQRQGTVTFGLAADAKSRGSAGCQDGVSDNDPRTLAEYVTHCPKIFVR